MWSCCLSLNRSKFWESCFYWKILKFFCSIFVYLICFVFFLCESRLVLGDLNRLVTDGFETGRVFDKNKLTFIRWGAFSKWSLISWDAFRLIPPEDRRRLTSAASFSTSAILCWNWNEFQLDILKSSTPALPLKVNQSHAWCNTLLMCPAKLPSKRKNRLIPAQKASDYPHL